MFSNIEISFDLVAFLGGAGVVSYYVYTKALRPFFNWTVKLVDSVSKIDVIYAQMFTNGGSTVRDSLNRIENRIAVVERKQTVYIMDTHNGSYESDAKGNLISVNRTYCRWTGRSEQELTGHGWLNTISEDDRLRVDEAWGYAVDNEIELELSYTMVNTDGKEFNVKCKAIPIKSGVGILIGYFGTIDKDNG